MPRSLNCFDARRADVVPDVARADMPPDGGAFWAARHGAVAHYWIAFRGELGAVCRPIRYRARADELNLRFGQVCADCLRIAPC